MPTDAPRDVHPTAPKDPNVVIPKQLWTCAKCKARVPEGYSCNCGRRQLNEG